MFMNARLLAGGVAAVLLSSLPAGAQPRAPVDEMAALSKEALEHAKKGEFEAARDLYAKAWEKLPNTPLLFNLALAELKSEHYIDALHHFDLYLTQPDAEPGKADLIKNRFRPQAYAATAHITIDDPSLAEARIALDGVEKDSHTLDMTPGEYEVSARMKDGSIWRANVTAVAGQTVTARLELVPRVDPTFKIEETKPLLAPPRASPTPESSRKTRNVVTVTVLGAAVLTAGGAVAFLLKSNSDDSHASDLRNQMPGRSSCAPPVPTERQAPCADLHDTVDEQVRFYNISRGMFIAGGALAVGGVLAYVLWPSRPKNVSVVPVVDPTGRAATVVGRFTF
jgi:hypothetical protein